MDRSRFRFAPGLWLDARRAVFFEESATLVVADLHLGYVWAHRHAGQLMPLSAPEKTAERLRALVEDYSARELVLLGDIVHRAVPVRALRAELTTLTHELSSLAKLTLVAGNHDRQLAGLLQECRLTLPLLREHRIGSHRLMHGDIGVTEPPLEPGGRIFIGHEHPAIRVSDGVANGVKCPCFLLAPQLVVLPAFSLWAAGTNVREANFLSPLSRAAKFETAVAIIANKLLPIPLRLERAVS